VAGSYLIISDRLKSLSVTIYSQLPFEFHANNVARACDYHTAPYIVKSTLYVVCWLMKWPDRGVQHCDILVWLLQRYLKRRITATIVGCKGLRTTSPASSASAVAAKTQGDEVSALAAGETSHHAQDRDADPQGADDVHAAISPRHGDRRRAGSAMHSVGALCCPSSGAKAQKKIKTKPPPPVLKKVWHLE